MVSIDTPLAPQRDLIALLKQTTAVPIDQSKIALRSFFIVVDEERSQTSNMFAEHVRDLMEKYQGQDESKCGMVVIWEKEIIEDDLMAKYVSDVRFSKRSCIYVAILGWYRPTSAYHIVGIDLQSTKMQFSLWNFGPKKEARLTI